MHNLPSLSPSLSRSLSRLLSRSLSRSMSCCCQPLAMMLRSRESLRDQLLLRSSLSCRIWSMGRRSPLASIYRSFRASKSRSSIRRSDRSLNWSCARACTWSSDRPSSRMDPRTSIITRSTSSSPRSSPTFQGSAAKGSSCLTWSLQLRTTFATTPAVAMESSSWLPFGARGRGIGVRLRARGTCELLSSEGARPCPRFSALLRLAIKLETKASSLSISRSLLLIRFASSVA
mmetsp:Transcript_38096/g.104868  ORF Transcript_38096/g.104868 Transcript_38096/m.104868 type:complete len:232 (+) Transcript_38096:518-1213(+)